MSIVGIVKKNFTGSAAIAASVAVPSPGGHYEVASVTLHYSADPGVEDLTITLNANAGVAYDTLLKTQPMSGVTDFVWAPDFELILEPGDSLDIAQANATAKTYGLQTTLKEVTG